MPHSRSCSSEPVRAGWNCSAFHTPSWHHTELTTSTRVLAAAYGTLSFGVFSVHRSGTTERMVKYIAKSPAKNMSSLDNQTMVRTDAMLGRLTDACAGAWTADADATGVIIAPWAGEGEGDPPGLARSVRPDVPPRRGPRWGRYDRRTRAARSAD